MGFFSEQTGDASPGNASRGDRPLSLSPGTYHVQITRSFDIAGDPEKGDYYRLFGVEGTVLETVYAYKEGEVGPIGTSVGQASRRPGQRVSHKWDLNGKWKNIGARKARELSEALITTHGFREALSTDILQEDGESSGVQFIEIFDEMQSEGEDIHSFVADLCLEHPDLFSGLILAVVTDELLDKDQKRRSDPMTKNALSGVSRETFERLTQ